MTDVVITGIGQTPVGEHWAVSLRALAVQAIQAALVDSGGMKPQALFVGNALAANLSRQAHLGALLADYAGLGAIEAATFEAGGASAAAALRQATLAIQSGLVDTVLVLGVEKFSDMIGAELEGAASTLTDSEYEAVHGLTPTAQAALLAQRYQHEFNLPAFGLAGFAITAHANGAGNCNAMYRKAISLETYQKAEMVCDPLNLYDIAPNADGAAALVLTRSDLLPAGLPHPAIKVSASASASDSLALHDRSNLLDFRAVRESTEAVFRKSGLGREQVDLFEYCDTSSIHAALSLEAAGFARPGEGWKLAADGSISRDGKLPCATLGGLKARGNPLGASGAYQAVEACLQLRRQAGENQVAGAKVALIQSLSGPACLAISHILERLEVNL